MIEQATIDAFQSQGAVVLPGLMADWVGTMRDGVEANMANPGPHVDELTRKGEPGRFFDDYCNWQRIPEFESVARTSPLPRAAAELMESKTAQFFHEHVLVKEPGTEKATPWHEDSPYYFVDGTQTVSFWMPLDPVGDATLRVIAGSHRAAKRVLPVRWLSQEAFFDEGDYRPVPDPDANSDHFTVLEWPMEPGDVLAFSYRTVHAARGNMTNRRRRALSMRYVGDDARYVERPGPTSPPFDGHEMIAGQRLREDWFPTVFSFG